MEFLIASRQSRPGDDPIFSLNAAAQQRAKAGGDVVNATIGALLSDDGKLAIMPSVAEAFSTLPFESVATYAPIPGREDYRKAIIADILGPYGLAGEAACVATPGGTGALRIAFDDFLEPGQTALTSSYFWAPYRTIAEESGRDLTTFEMFDEAGRFNVAAFDRKLDELMGKQARALVLLNTPCHNPTGYSLDQAELDAASEVLARHAHRGPVTLVLDVAYGYFEPEALERCIATFVKLAGKVMVLFAWSGSKAFALYGQRVGALVALCPEPAQRERITNAITYSCRGIWSNCNAGGMAAVAKLLSDERLHAQVLAERAELVRLLARRVDFWNERASAAGLRYPRYAGGFFTTVFSADPKRTSKALSDLGVFLVPTAGAVRVAMCAVNEQQIARIVDALRAVGV
ncbi:MAG: aminotransferase class I/II-fold pyridoxal phosphate-dependent enzyme [Deltaproteobacteria bacterium]|nr:aminotransferase class I/II-fold pyridoxal phosphate-dependent enzyme [Deltaproteobacteria bacterium]